jgi:hypothetical protein
MPIPRFLTKTQYKQLNIDRMKMGQTNQIPDWHRGSMAAAACYHVSVALMASTLTNGKIALAISDRNSRAFLTKAPPNKSRATSKTGVPQYGGSGAS